MISNSALALTINNTVTGELIHEKVFGAKISFGRSCYGSGGEYGGVCACSAYHNCVGNGRYAC